MPETIVFLSRKARGRGGMQKYSRDLTLALSQLQNVKLKVASPFSIFTILCAKKLHIGDVLLAPFGAVLKFCKPRTRVTITAHGLDVIYRPFLYQKLIRWALPRMDAVICVSSATAREVRARGVPASRVHIVPCGIWQEKNAECRMLNGKNGGPVLVSVGRLILRKGVAWFIDQVLPKLVEYYPDLEYHVVGKGSDELRICWAVHRRNLGKYVYIHGAVSDDVRDELLERSDIFVMPNIVVKGDMEGFGIACIEASSMGLPVAAARVDGLIDAVIEGKTGAFFSSGVADDAVRTIRSLLERPLSAISVQQETSEHYSWEKLISRYVDILLPPPPPSALRSTPHRSALLTWDYANAKGGLGRAMVMLADRLPIHTVFSPTEGFLSFTKRFGGHVLFSLLLPFTLQGWIDRNKITELIVPVGPGGVFLLCHPRRCSVTVVSHHNYVQQMRLVPGESWKRIFIPIERRTLRMASKVLCYTEDAQRDLKKRYGVQASLTIHPFDCEIWTPTSEPQKQKGLCVCVARISKRKGTDVLLRAWPAVRRAMPHAKLVLIGEGKVPAHLEGVDHFNSVSLKELVALVQRAEVAVCPSYVEGFGYACAEAMAAGTAVVASDVPGLRALITDDKTGRLVPAGDTIALTEAIIEILKDSTIARVFADRARNNIREQFGIKAQSETLQKALSSL